MMAVLRTENIELVLLGDPFSIDESILDEKALVLKLLSSVLASRISVRGRRGAS
jgi:hypothetical protein